VVNSLYVTFDYLNPDSGAGKVCLHEISALNAVSELQFAVSRGGNIDIPHKVLNLDKVYQFNPYLYDYFVADMLSGHTDFMHLSCSPAVAILEKVKPKKYVVNIVAHHLQTSIEEHERIYRQPYPFIHNVDSYLHSVLLKHVKHADCVFTPSEHSKEWILENIQPKQVKVIPHGCDLPTNIPPLPEDFTVGYIGAWGPDKGLLYLLLAWESLGWKDSKLVFAGPCCEQLKPWIQEFASTSNIELMGWVKTPYEFFEKVSVVCVPSVSEGFGLLTLEGMAHGRVPIVTTGAGSSMIVNDGKDGIVIPPRNPKVIADALRHLKDQGTHLYSMSNNAVATAADYTWDKIEELYKQSYREILG